VPALVALVGGACDCATGARTEECWNFVDDDGDGQADCYDGDCSASIYCFCAVDDGCDCPGVLAAPGPDAAVTTPPPDAAVPTAAPPCVELACADGDDNDRDGAADCDDADCYAPCGVELGNFTPTALPVAENLYAVWGAGPCDVFAVGENATLLHFNDPALGWQEESAAAPSAQLRDVTGLVASTGNTIVYAVGFNGTILHYGAPVCAGRRCYGNGPACAGGGWVAETATDPLTMGNPAVTVDLHGVWTASDGNLAYAVGDGGYILRREPADGTWSRVDSGVLDRLFDVWGSSPNDIWAAGTFGVIVHYDGTAWSEVSLAAQGIFLTGAWHGIWGSASDRVFFVGVGGQVVRWDGALFTEVPGAPATPLLDVFGVGPEVFMVGLDGYLVHLSAGNFFYYVWGDPPGRPQYRWDGVWGYDPYDYLDSGVGDSGIPDAGPPYDLTVVGASGAMIVGP
jgi:hypothetical protein